MNLRRSTLALAMAALPLVVAACSGDDSSDATSTSAGSVASSLNDADVQFLQAMIPHHEQAVEMAGIALDPVVGAGADVLALAGRVKAAQDPEIRQMTAWLTAAGEPLEAAPGGHDMSSMDGLMTTQEMDTLAAVTGAEFDTLWMELMIRHHQGAIAMAEDVTDEGADSGVRTLAGEIIAAQQAEITEMRDLLDG